MPITFDSMTNVNFSFHVLTFKSITCFFTLEKLTRKILTQQKVHNMENADSNSILQYTLRFISKCNCSYVYFLFSTVLLLLLNKVHVILFKIFILTILFSVSNLKLSSIHEIVVIDARNSLNGFSIIFINNTNTIHRNDCSRKMMKK